MLKTGTVLENKWVILESLGKGGMGEVFRAHQLNLKRDVAIKIVSRDWLETLNGDEKELENAISRFRREVKATASIRHPNVVQIMDHGSTTLQMDGKEVPLEYIVMEYIPGATLRFTMSDEGFHPEENLVSTWLRDYFFPVLDSVEAIHASGIVHRDLKPENVLMDGNIPKIADFGLAASKRLEPITGSVDVKGTAAYMSPEQFVDLKRTDVRTDIYALGKILHEAIAGRMPPTTIPFKTASLDHPTTPFFKEVDRIIRTATAERKEDRFDSVTAFRDALKKALLDEATTRRGPVEASGMRERSRYFKWIWVGVFVVLLAVSAMTVWHFSGKPQWTPSKVPGPSSVTSSAPAELDRESPPPGVGEEQQTASPEGQVPPEVLQGKDGAVLHLVPGGAVTIAEDFGPQSGKTVDLPPIYMDETLVTNYQYVEFLNQMLSKIEVADGVVRGEGNIWLLLGEVVDGYDPIEFRNGKFHVTKPAHAACPVVRVTPYGASAYAAFYGRRLPTDLEWLNAVKEGRTEQKDLSKEVRSPGADSGPISAMEHMHSPTQPSVTGSPEAPPFPSPVMLYPANALGIRGLNHNVGEWGIREIPSASEVDGRTTENVILGGPAKKSKGASGLSSPVPRRPWEAFEEVGFRCVVTASTPSTVAYGGKIPWFLSESAVPGSVSKAG